MYVEEGSNSWEVVNARLRPVDNLNDGGRGRIQDLDLEFVVLAHYSSQ